MGSTKLSQVIFSIPHVASLQSPRLRCPLVPTFSACFISTSRSPVRLISINGLEFCKRSISLPAVELKSADDVNEEETFMEEESTDVLPSGFSRSVLLGAVSISIFVMLSELCEQRAMALGPEGPLVEEFWDNMRRYGLYALTVSTGAIWTILQPIVELLKNPISAVLILIILVGTLFLLSQVLNAMIGVTEFAYDYAY